MSGRTLAVILVATVAMIITWAFYAFFAREVTHFIEGKHHWFHNYEPWSLLGFISVFIVATSLFLPAQPFVVAAGYLFGFHFLTILFTVAVYALAAFFMFNGARFWFRPLADEWLREHKVVLGMARYVKDPVEGAKLNFLFSFTPIAFCIHCYVMGITEIDEHIFLATFLLGQSPHIFFGILTGSALLAAESASLSLDSFKIGMLALGVICTFAAMIYLMHMAEEVLRNIDDGSTDRLLDGKAPAGYSTAHGAAAAGLMEEGRCCGVGLTFEEGEDQALVVARVWPGSPAALSGQVREGDVLHEVDGRNVLRARAELISQVVPGPEGTAVRLGLRRPYPAGAECGGEETITIQLLRAPLCPTATVLLAAAGAAGGKRAEVAPRLEIRAGAAAGASKTYGSAETQTPPVTPDAGLAPASGADFWQASAGGAPRRRVVWQNPPSSERVFSSSADGGGGGVGEGEEWAEPQPVYVEVCSR